MPNHPSLVQAHAVEKLGRTGGRGGVGITRLTGLAGEVGGDLRPAEQTGAALDGE